MSKSTTLYICQACGGSSPKWAGQCPHCHTWNTLVETVSPTLSRHRSSRKQPPVSQPIKLKDIATTAQKRLTTGQSELDHTLGGGLVPGEAVLLAGQPGIGKSTLLSQLALNLSNCLYICGEESPSQVKLRLNRLINAAKANFSLLPDTDTDTVCHAIETTRPSLVIIDSIQTLTTTDLTGPAGSAGQVRESADRLIRLAKKLHLPLILVGHITKAGQIAGPKLLEHMVDCVLYLEGDKLTPYRILRSYKNRFGPVDEIGIFEMTNKVLIEPDNRSSLFLNSDGPPQPGSVISIVKEGNRLLAVEIQSLVTPTATPYPKRISQGINPRRLDMLIAIVQKHLKLPLYKYDVFVNLAGGLTISDPAADLAVCLGLYHSYKSTQLTQTPTAIGEVGLMGEIRHIPGLDQRLKHARKLKLVLPISPATTKSLSQTTKTI